jgi:hypothetical protein
MIPLRRWLLILLTVSWFAAAGCGDSDPPGSTGGQTDVATAGQPTPKQPAESDNAAAAFLVIVDGFRHSRPEVIWEFLPESHQQDVNRLAREFAVRMDADLWRRTAAVARQSADVLKTRKAQILSHPAFRDGEWAADGAMSRKWDGFVALLQTLAGSELADLEKMKSFDGRTFFSQFDAVSLAHLQDLSILLNEDNPFSMLRQMVDGGTVRLVPEQRDGVATVRIEPDGGEPREFDFVRVEGKWLPKAWAAGFRDDIRRARARLDVELAKNVLARKKQLMMPFLENATEILNELQQAETEEEFHNVMTQRIIKPAMLIAESTAGAPQTATAPVDLKATPRGAVTIVVRRELDAATVDRIADALLDDRGVDRDLTDETSAGRTVFVVSPVKDVAAFAKTIRFGAVKQVDAEARTITVDVPMPESKPVD